MRFSQGFSHKGTPCERAAVYASPHKWQHVALGSMRGCYARRDGTRYTSCGPLVERERIYALRALSIRANRICGRLRPHSILRNRRCAHSTEVPILGKRKGILCVTGKTETEKEKERSDSKQEGRNREGRVGGKEGENRPGLAAGASLAFTTGRQRAVYRMSFTWESLIGEELCAR